MAITGRSDLSHPPPRATIRGMSSRDDERITMRGRATPTMRATEFYCFVTPDRADITHDRVHILVKTLMFIVLSFVLASSLSSDDHKSVSKILCRRLVQTICTPPVNTELPGCAPCLAARLVIFTKRKILTSYTSSSVGSLACH